MLTRVRSWLRSLIPAPESRPQDAADAAVQLERAIGEAREQHRLLADQAANVIANEVQVRARLDRAVAEYERVTSSAGSSLLRADEAQRAGDIAEAGRWNDTATAYAARVVALETEIADLRSVAAEASRASAQARDAVQQSAQGLRRRLVEQEQLRGRLDQARLQEQINDALRADQPAPPGTLTYEQLEREIDRRLASAQALAELRAGPDLGALEVDRAARGLETEARLDAMRHQLGLDEAAPTPHP